MTKELVRVGCVSYLNAKPLIWGLEGSGGVELGLEVPSRLLEGMRGGRYDVALLPVIDYQRMEGLRVLRSGGIGSDGATLTVRIFSKVPAGEIRRLGCDTDSHTSVALARVLLSERFGCRPVIVDWGRGEPSPQPSPGLPGEGEKSADAWLLIGDKVVCEEPRGFAHEWDLGEEWKGMTGRPFVFAAWMAREGVEIGDLEERLERAKREGLAHVEEIIERDAVPRGWPAGVARRYLTEHLKFDVGEREIEAMNLFYRLAKKVGVIDEVREVG